MPVHQPRGDPIIGRRSSVTAAAQRREEGRRRVGTVTRWAVAATVAGAAALGAGYAHAIPGIQAQPPASQSGSIRTGTSGGLQPPASAPNSAQQSPHTQSGAS
jgi:hypothetical protein